MFQGYFERLLAQTQWPTVLEKLILITIIIALMVLALRIRTKIITRAFRVTGLEESKKQSLVSMLMSFTRYTIYFIAIMVILRQFVDITPLIAGAGVLGLAIGFGAQSLVKDVITGFFIMFEDQFHVGDFVEINGEATGAVEDIGLRMTTIREWSGKKFYIHNSEIRTVRNYNRRELRAIVSATFPYEEDPVEIRRLLEEVCRQVERDFHEDFLKDAEGNMIEPPQVLGVTDIDKNDKGGSFTIIAKTYPASLWKIERAIREYIWQNSYRRGIKIAYPRRVFMEHRRKETPN